MNTTYNGIPGGYYPPWDSANISKVNYDTTQLGYIKGPFISYLIYPDSYPNRNRDVCVLRSNAEISCWTLPLRTNLTLSSLRPYINSYYDVTSLRIPHNDFCEPSIIDPDLCISNLGPFQSISFMPFPLIGRYDSTIVDSRTIVYTGSKRWNMICGNTGKQILCYGIQNFNNQINSINYL